MLNTRCSVLVVDDESYVLSMLSALLAKEFEVLTAASAEQAQEVLSHREVDIVLSDQNLTGQNGVDLLRWVRERCPSTARVLITGQASIEDAADAINIGQVHRFLFKPCHAEHLIQTLRGEAKRLLLERSHEQLLEEYRRLNAELEQRVQQRTHELEEANRQLQYKNSILERMALTDPLTGLPNRRAMDRLVKTELLRRARHPAPITLAVVDVDHFKEVNTLHLLPGGDHVLVWLGQVLSGSVRTVDTVGRIGGEEFMVLAPDTGSDGAATLAERIRSTVETGRTSFNDREIRITVSVGAAVADGEVPASYDQLKHLAATCLGEAKATGRNRCMVQSVPK